MSSHDRMLTAHLARRAGFGATRDQLDRYVSMGYEAMVEELLHPADSQHTPADVIYRRFPEYHASPGPDAAVGLEGDAAAQAIQLAIEYDPAPPFAK